MTGNKADVDTASETSEIKGDSRRCGAEVIYGGSSGLLGDERNSWKAEK